ncbi:MAG: response regulator, partial [Deltaproteobacteria bacterium]|nr:response regulator [Deltaproteobacteria bacterium]
PGLGGLEATRLLRQKESETEQHIPIIALTAHAMKSDQDKCLDAGMDDFITKPIKTAELFQKIEQLFEN